MQQYVCLWCDKRCIELFDCEHKNKCHVKSFCVNCTTEHGNICKKLNTCKNCNAYDVYLFGCNRTYRCTITNIYCFKCRNNHNNSECDNANKCNQCGNISLKFYRCMMTNSCNLYYCKACVKKHDGKKCNNKNKCRQCKLKFTQLYYCNKKQKCCNKKIYCITCRNNHTSKKCPNKNTCFGCKKILTYSYQCTRIMKCSGDNMFCCSCIKNGHTANCDIDSTCFICKKKCDKLYECSRFNKCIKYKVFCKACLKVHTEHKQQIMKIQESQIVQKLIQINNCISINTCCICKEYVTRLYICGKNKRCCYIKKYCKKCSTKHETILCKKLNNCFTCGEQSKFVHCRDSRCLCNKSTQCYCIKCEKKHNKLYFDNKCFNCGLISNTYYVCHKSNKCTT